MEILEKHCIFKNTHNKREYDGAITFAYCSIPKNVLLSTVDSFECRVQLCMDNNGQIFERLLKS